MSTFKSVITDSLPGTHTLEKWLAYYLRTLASTFSTGFAVDVQFYKCVTGTNVIPF